jgi:hypothetical protein
MIRREEQGSFLLITQHDHALISGELAEHFGNELFAAPQPRKEAVRGVALHDCGWPLHDDEPTINPDGLPLHVFETSREIALKVWTASVERATTVDPYAGLLVSLHVLNLSVFASTLPQFSGENPPERFAMIKFQQKEIERQEKLRMQLGLRTDRPGHHKLPHDVTQKKEDLLTFNFRMLQAMDVISLAACCTTPPTSQTQDIIPQPGGAPQRLSLARNGNDVIVDPWPFNENVIELMIPVCRIPRKKYESDEDLRAATRAGSSEVLNSRVIPG